MMDTSWECAAASRINVDIILLTIISMQTYTYVHLMAQIDSSNMNLVEAQTKKMHIVHQRNNILS